MTVDIDFLILADAAQVAEGKLYLMGGGWDRLAVNALPVVQSVGVAVGVAVPWAETNTGRTLTIAIDDEDGSPVLPAVSVRVEVGRPPGLPPGVEQRVMFALNAQVQLARLGEYVLTVALDGERRRHVRFNVQPGPQYRPAAG